MDSALQTLLLAILKQLLRQFPQITPAVIIAALGNISEDAWVAMRDWWNSYPHMEHEWPENPGIPVPPPEEGTGV